MNPYEKVPSASPDAIASVVNLSSKIQAAYPGLFRDFDTKYTEWRNSWFSGANQSSSTYVHKSNPRVKRLSLMGISHRSSAPLASGPQFASLVVLGPKVIPLVVSKLTLSGDFFVVELCRRTIKDIQSSMRS